MEVSSSAGFRKSLLWLDRMGTLRPRSAGDALKRRDPYVCALDASSAWQAACDYGFDMSLEEDALRRTPEEVFEEHQWALNRVLEIMAARELNQQHGSGR